MLTTILAVTAAITGHKFELLYIFMLFMDWEILSMLKKYLENKNDKQ